MKNREGQAGPSAAVTFVGDSPLHFKMGKEEKLH